MTAVYNAPGNIADPMQIETNVTNAASGQQNNYLGLDLSTDTPLSVDVNSDSSQLPYQKGVAPGIDGFRHGGIPDTPPSLVANSSDPTWTLYEGYKPEGP